MRWGVTRELHLKNTSFGEKRQNILDELGRYFYGKRTLEFAFSTPANQAFFGRMMDGEKDERFHLFKAHERGRPSEAGNKKSGGFGEKAEQAPQSTSKIKASLAYARKFFSSRFSGFSWQLDSSRHAELCIGGFLCGLLIGEFGGYALIESYFQPSFAAAGGFVVGAIACAFLGAGVASSGGGIISASIAGIQTSWEVCKAIFGLDRRFPGLFSSSVKALSPEEYYFLRGKYREGKLREYLRYWDLDFTDDVENVLRRLTPEERAKLLTREQEDVLVNLSDYRIGVACRQELLNTAKAIVEAGDLASDRIITTLKGLKDEMKSDKALLKILKDYCLPLFSAMRDGKDVFEVQEVSVRCGPPQFVPEHTIMRGEWVEEPVHTKTLHDGSYFEYGGGERRWEEWEETVSAHWEAPTDLFSYHTVKNSTYKERIAGMLLSLSTKQFLGQISEEEKQSVMKEFEREERRRSAELSQKIKRVEDMVRELSKIYPESGEVADLEAKGRQFESLEKQLGALVGEIKAMNSMAELTR